MVKIMAKEKYQIITLPISNPFLPGSSRRDVQNATRVWHGAPQRGLHLLTLVLVPLDATLNHMDWWKNMEKPWKKHGKTIEQSWNTVEKPSFHQMDWFMAVSVCEL